VASQGSYELPADDTALIAALKALPVSERRAIVLYHLGGLSVEQTAADMRAPVGTVKSWLSRGRARLRAELASQDLEVTS
jgi:RNA polymerase sigma-70 factor (ECF subfamily)